MKTTIELPESVYRRSQRAAQKLGLTVEELIVSALEGALSAEGEGTTSRNGVKLPLLSSKKPGSLNLDNYNFDDLVG